MIGDNRDPRPTEWGNFAEAAGYGSFVAYPGSEYTILPQAGVGWDGWGSVFEAALASIGNIFSGGGGGSTWQGPSISTVGIPKATVGVTIPSYGDIEVTEPQGEWLPGGSIYEDNPQPPTDWDEVFRQMVILETSGSSQTDDYEEETVAIDWGGLVNIGVDFLQGQATSYAQPAQQFVAAGAPGLPAPSSMPTAAPRLVTVDTVTGKITACKRRRRRRLLTEGDFNDLMRISTLPGNQNVRIALAKSIGRR